MEQYQNIIGRKEEISALLNAYESTEPAFVAVYGRRRVGKTYLVKEVLKDKFSFVFTGTAKISNKQQLDNFRMALVSQGHCDCPQLSNWFEAFSQLSQFIDSLPEGKKVVFIDELPWLDGKGSKFVPALEHFWNGWANYRDDMLFVVCGSATSWIINKVINSHGGLHNRVTEQIYLRPFTLAECEQYLIARNIKLSRYDIVIAYMIFGGIPYYLSMLKRGKSLTQNIDAMCFKRGGALVTEYTKLYDSLFSNPEPYVSIITALKGKTYGLTREEISKKCKIANNGHLSRYLADLVQCDFVRCSNTIGMKKKDTVYQMIDNFTIFYFSFMERAIIDDAEHWTYVANSSEFRTWSGLSFERVCLWHLPQIKKALGISGVLSSACCWQTDKQQAKDYGGAQIDLLIERKDGVINLCEMKFSRSEYTIDKEEDSKLRHRLEVFERLVAKRRAVHITMITPYGITPNTYSSLVQSQVTLDSLFE